MSQGSTWTFFACFWHNNLLGRVTPGKYFKLWQAQHQKLSLKWWLLGPMKEHHLNRNTGFSLFKTLAASSLTFFSFFFKVCTSHTHSQLSPFHCQDLTRTLRSAPVALPRIKTRNPVSKPRQRQEAPRGATAHQRQAGLQSSQGHLERLRGSLREARPIIDTELFLAAGMEMHPKASPVPGLPAKRSQLLSLWNSSGCFQSSSTVPVLHPASPLFWQLVSMLYPMIAHQWKNWKIMSKGLGFFFPLPRFIAFKKQAGWGDNWPNSALLLV